MPTSEPQKVPTPRPPPRRGEDSARPRAVEPGRILVVDDDRVSRDLMKKVLASDGHEVVTCNDGKEAVAQANGATAFDVVVSDIRMVEADGLEVLRAFREHAPTTPVILVTAFGNVDGAVDAIKKGAFDYISKPYDVDQIRVVVGRA